jgi:DNA polymerase III epsilon subunit-like protein
MIDIETLDTKSSAVILSIGAVEFDEQRILSEFHRHIDIQSCIDKGLTVSGSTILWWLEQSEEARTRLQQPANQLEAVLAELQQAFNWDGKEVWANGSDFDLPILANAYRACGYSNAPWPYYQGRDYRTVRKMFPKSVLNEYTVEPVCAHDALEDARAQVLTLQGLMASGVQPWSIAA